MPLFMSFELDDSFLFRSVSAFDKVTVSDSLLCEILNLVRSISSVITSRNFLTSFHGNRFVACDIPLLVVF